MPHENVKEQLSYEHMMALVHTFPCWALNRQFSSERSVQLVGQAMGMYQMADP